MNNNKKRINFSLFIVFALQKSYQSFPSKASQIQEPVLHLGRILFFVPI